MKDFINSLIRHGLTTMGGALAADGLLKADDTNAAIGAITTLAGIGLSLYKNYKTKKRKF